MYDKLLKNGQICLPGEIRQTSVAVKDGKIAAIGDVDPAQAKEVIDCAGLHILPGIIDTQVHFREPGGEHKEDLETGSHAAALGGVTAFFEMPNTNPLTVTPEALKDKMSRAAGRCHVDYAFYFGGTAENAGHLAEWENLPGVCGVKIFMGSSTGSLLSAKDEEVEAVLRNGRRIVAVHAEDEFIMDANKAEMLGDAPHVRQHPDWRSVDSTMSAVERLIRIARKTGRRVHVLHVTAAEEVAFLAEHKDIATVEVLPNHITLAAPSCYDDLGSKAQQNPPIREQHHQDALWTALQDGTIDIIGSDHAPHTLEEKAAPYPKSPSGTPGVQTMLPIMLDHVNAGKLSLLRLVDLLCEAPLRIHQIAGKGRIAKGYDADFTVVDLKARHTINNEEQASRAGWTPYHGKTVTGMPKMTIVRGRVVMRDGDLVEAHQGKPVIFRETLSLES